MTHFASRNLFQDITYWAPTNSPETNDYGHPVLGVGVEIKGRWEDRTQQIRRPNGDEITSMSEVYVDRDLIIGGYVKLGKYAGSAVSAHNDAKEIQDFRVTPDLRNLGQERRAYL